MVWNKSKKVKKSVDKSQSKVIKRLSQLLTADLNRISTSNAGAVSTGGNVYAISLLAQGVAEGSRDSNNIVVTSIKGTVQFTIGATNQFARVMIFRDVASGGSLPLQAELIQSPALAISPMSPIQFNNRKRFVKLYEKKFAIDANPGVLHQYSWNLNFKNPKTTTFLDATNASTALGSNQYYLYFDSSGAGANSPNQTYYCTTTYQE